MKIEESAGPQIGEDDVLVKVLAAGANPSDWKIREGRRKEIMPKSFPLTMGQDFAGEVAEAGKKVNQFKAGDAVFGFGSGS